MKRVSVVLFVVCILVGGAFAAFAEDLTVALSSLSTESLDPILGGHIVKFYLDQIFDYLVGMTADGQLAADGGIATRWESSADHKRWTFYLRRGGEVPQRRRADVRGRQVQPAARDGQALDDRLCRAAARAHQGHRDAGPGS